MKRKWIYLIVLIAFLLSSCATSYKEFGLPQPPYADHFKTPVPAVSENNFATPTVDAVLAKKLACTLPHHGQTFTIPYDNTYKPPLFDAEKLTKFDYVYRGIKWHMEATCEDNYVMGGQMHWVETDIPEAPAGPTTSFTCDQTDVTVSGVGAMYQCNDITPSGFSIHLQDGGTTQDDTVLAMRWNWDQNNPDIGSGEHNPMFHWWMHFLATGQHLDSKVPANLECKWTYWEGYTPVGTSGIEFLLEDIVSGTFSFEDKATTTAICVGDGYTVTMTAK